MSFPTYKIEIGMAERTMRKVTFTQVIHLLVCQISAKNFGRFFNAASLCLKLSCSSGGSFPLLLGLCLASMHANYYKQLFRNLNTVHPSARCGQTDDCQARLTAG